ncbi:MAG: hypothetical protein N2B06_09480 [Clostridium sp.]
MGDVLDFFFLLIGYMDYTIIESASGCPVVFEIIQRLKKMCNFKRREG